MIFFFIEIFFQLFVSNISGQGCSTNPCSQTYCGSAPESEVEAEQLADYILRLGGGDSFDVFITMHSFSQLWMSPWGFTVDLPDDHDDLVRF